MFQEYLGIQQRFINKFKTSLNLRFNQNDDNSSIDSNFISKLWTEKQEKTTTVDRSDLSQDSDFDMTIVPDSSQFELSHYLPNKRSHIPTRRTSFVINSNFNDQIGKS